MKSIYLKEMNSFLNSMIAYVVIIVFITFISLYMWVFPDTNVMDGGFAEMEALFSFGPIAFLFLIPAITMRTFAEEKKDGTIELLYTKPVNDTTIILSKYFASLTLVAFSILPTLVYYFSIYSLGNPVGNIDTASVASSYIGLIALGAVYVSIGIFASSISNNQILSFILSFIISYFLFDGISRIANLNLFEGSLEIIESLGLDYHYNALGKGVLDSRNIFYFLSVIFIMIQATKLVVGSRKW